MPVALYNDTSITVGETYLSISEEPIVTGKGTEYSDTPEDPLTDQAFKKMLAQQTRLALDALTPKRTIWENIVEKARAGWRWVRSHHLEFKVKYTRTEPPKDYWGETTVFEGL